VPIKQILLDVAERGGSPSDFLFGKIALPEREGPFFWLIKRKKSKC
jgi:hypothetical protein